MRVSRMLRKLSGVLLAGAAISFCQIGAAQSLDANGYWYWWTLVDGAKGAVQGDGNGQVWTDRTKAPATGSDGAWTLAPNTSLCQDNLDLNDAGGITYWCTDKKWVKMKTYETTTVAAGAPSKATFSGCFGPATGMSGHTVSAFLSILAADYSATYANDESSAACWDLEFDIAGDVPVIVQKGYIVEGPNADPRDGAPGSIIAYEGVTVAPGFAQFAPGIPALPLGGLLGLIALVGWMGMRRR